MEKMREEFEDWVVSELDYDVSKSSSGTYHELKTFIAWECWKASRAALCVELPVSCDAAGLHCDCEVYEASSVRELLDKVGVSHK